MDTDTGYLFFKEYQTDTDTDHLILTDTNTGYTDIDYTDTD